MASDLRLRVGAATGTVTISAAVTDAQVATALRRYCTSLGISQEGTSNEQLTRILQHWVDDVVRVAKAVQLKEVEAAQKAANQALVDADNALLPTP